VHCDKKARKTVFMGCKCVCGGGEGQINNQLCNVAGNVTVMPPKTLKAIKVLGGYGVYWFSQGCP
jgi:hypothetical protein